MWWLCVQHRPGTIASELLEYSYSVLWGEENLAVWVWTLLHYLTFRPENVPDSAQIIDIRVAIVSWTGKRGPQWSKWSWQYVFLHSPQILFELPEAEGSLCLGKAVLISILVYNWLLTEYWLIENLETDQHLTALLWSAEKGRGTIRGCKAAGLLATKSQFYPIDRWEIS